jgi:hypothetical protein
MKSMDPDYGISASWKRNIVSVSDYNYLLFRFVFSVYELLSSLTSKSMMFCLETSRRTLSERPPRRSMFFTWELFRGAFEFC